MPMKPDHPRYQEMQERIQDDELGTGLREHLNELANALEACREVILGINSAHIPGYEIPEFDTGVGAFTATEMATIALRKVGRL